MINNNNENINKVRTDKWFSAILITYSASLIGAVTVTSGSAAQTQNMTSANATAVNNGLQEQMNRIPGFEPFDPFTNGDDK